MIKIAKKNVLDFQTDEKYHAIISDPPYGLAFMGKGWDSFKTPLDYQKWVTEWSSHLMQFLYPGAICMFFGGTRTYHRLATGLEDAGYEIFDSMIWCYGSGFPKSYNISKGIDKSLGLKGEILEIKENSFGREQGGGKGWAEFITDGGNTKHNFEIRKPASLESEQWNGYGTALKPAYEPIVICRKPLEKGGYVNSVLKYGTSGLNIDGGRVEGSWNRSTTTKQDITSNNWNNAGDKRYNIEPQFSNTLGRFPANFGLICDCECEPCECDNGNLGESSRFFYTAKASSKERELGLEGLDKNCLQTLGNGLSTHNIDNEKMYRLNNHPTVKPIKLIEYLATLLLPPIDNSSILIPFSGVGSEMIGCYLAGWQNITGIEIDEHYVEIAKTRLKYWKQFEDYDSAMKSKTNPQTSFQDTLVAK